MPSFDISDTPEKACYCDSRQCDICTPDIRGDLRRAIQTLAADNARLCIIVMAAERLAKAIEEVRYLKNTVPSVWEYFSDALDAYKIARDGS